MSPSAASAGAKDGGRKTSKSEKKPHASSPGRLLSESYLVFSSLDIKFI